MLRNLSGTVGRRYGGEPALHTFGGELPHPKLQCPDVETPGERLVSLRGDREPMRGYLRAVGRGEARATQLSDTLVVDHDAQGRLVGIEVVFASRMLSPEVIAAAEDITGPTAPSGT